ncbi:MAG TPA: beta-ketoacyl-[acyl-carrier-protein] synthase family protein [Thermoanaerobaculia bacterium]|nr:beta-ketoacyl-[acyl-carrier-protein] synthase family protein [Thermoanaerobaculia bacterium]
MTRRVVVTGMGVIAPNGADVDAFRASLEAGRSAVGPIRRFSASSFPTRIGAEIDELDAPAAIDPALWAQLDRIARFALAASVEAIADARLAPSSHVGISIAGGLGSYDHEEVFTAASAGQTADGFDWRAFREQFLRTVKPRALARWSPGSIPALIARQFGFTGPAMSAMTACAASTQALGDGARWIRRGDADVVLAGGADSELYPMGLASFCLLRALSRRNDEPQRASRPFSATRDGFVLGEGAGMLVLEEREHAIARGATIHAEVLGFGSACDSYRVTDPHPDGVGATLAMQRALAQAGLSATDVDYINAHGTSTTLNDRIEVAAVKRLFGDHAPRLAISSTKSMIGHLTVAAGAVEAIATICSLQEQLAHPTINLDDPDPECDLDFVPNEARPMKIDVALSNSFAFGGQCASIALGRG